MAKNPMVEYQKRVNKEFKHKLLHGYLKVRVNVFGSFLSMRIDDADGEVSVKLANEIVVYLANMFYKDKLQKTIKQPAITYHMDGVVANWSIYD